MSTPVESVVQACGTFNLSCSQSYLPVAISGFALLVSFASALLAFKKNRSDLSTPWVSILLKYVEEEFKSVDLHQRAFSRTCGTPFPDVNRKRTVIDEMYRLREDSSLRLSGLCALVPRAADLRDKRAALDGVSDSFFENEALELPSRTALDLQNRYSEKLKIYLEALRAFSRGVWQRDIQF